VSTKNRPEPADVGTGVLRIASDLPKVSPASADLPEKTGRLSYSSEMAEAICAEIITGRSLPDISRDPGMPHVRTIFRWLANQPEFQRLYELACLSRTHALAEEIIAISDDDSADWIEEPAKHGAGVVRRADNAAVQRARLKVDSRKWLLSKLQPRKYGDRVSAELTGANGGPIKTEQAFPDELKSWSDEDLFTLREILLRAAGPDGGDNG